MVMFKKDSRSPNTRQNIEYPLKDKPQLRSRTPNYSIWMSKRSSPVSMSKALQR